MDYYYHCDFCGTTLINSRFKDNPLSFCPCCCAPITTRPQAISLSVTNTLHTPRPYGTYGSSTRSHAKIV